MDCFEEKLLNHIQRNGLFAGVRRVLLAVSGGADSVVMAHSLHTLRQSHRLACELAIGHVNHCLRDSESDADEQFVKELAQGLGIACLSTRVDVRAHVAVNKLSIETAARALRHDALIAQCKKLNCDTIATAHHAGDQAETIIHRLMRGTGFRGLCGIRPAVMLHGIKFIRPVLCLSRREIEHYCAENKLSWRHDSTNLDIEYTRNRIRHALLPKLETDWPTLQECLGRLAEDCGQMQDRIETHARTVFAKSIATRQQYSISMHRHIIAECPPWIFYEVMREVLVQLGTGLRDYTQSHFDSIHQQFQKGTGRRQYPGGIRVKAKSKTVTIEFLTADC